MQTRDAPRTTRRSGEAILSATLDSAIAPMIAPFANPAILIVTAAHSTRAGTPAAAEIQDAYRLIAPLIGVPIASFCSRAAWRRPELGRDRDDRWPGRHGGLSRAESPPSWLRRLVTRLLAIIPSIIIASFYCHRGVGKLLIASQIMLSLQLPFADLPTRDGSTSSHGSWPK